MVDADDALSTFQLAPSGGADADRTEAPDADSVAFLHTSVYDAMVGCWEDVGEVETGFVGDAVGQREAVDFAEGDLQYEDAMVSRVPDCRWTQVSAISP